MGFIQLVWAQLQGVPAAFWGVVFGSLVSLAGVLVSNRAGERRHRVQLEHDRGVRQQERDLSLRKDVYLAAAEAIQTGAVLLGSIANLERPHEDGLKPYFDKLPALAKVQVVGLPGTLAAMAEVSGAMAVSILELTGRRIPLDVARQQLIGLNGQIAEFVKERDRWLEEIKQFNVAGNTDQRLWTTLKENLEFEDGRITEARARATAAASALFSGQLDLARDCLDHARRINGLLIPAIVAVRFELGVPGETATFVELMHALDGKQQAATERFFAAARRIGPGGG